MEVYVKGPCINRSDLTELSKEWVLARDGQPTYKQLVMVVNIVFGKPYVKFTVYKKNTVVITTPDLEIALDQYNKILQVSLAKS